MKILITGTHFTPAQAVIEELKKQKNIEVIYIGRKTTKEGDSSISLESQVLPQMGVKFIPIISGRLQRTFTFYTIPSLFKIPLGFLQAFYLLLQERPNVVLSFGGYVAMPVVISAWFLSIPVIIHEQTLVSGLANTVGGWFADKVAVSFKENTSFNQNKTILTGNPLRKDVLEPNGKDVDHELEKMIGLAHEEKLPLILITGGNQGSHVINTAVGEIIDDLSKTAYVIHQTGDSKFNDFEKLLALKQKRYLPLKWINGADMGWILLQADLVVSRAGVNTLLELAYFKVPTLVIPISYLHKDEQNVNAKFFEKLGLVKILPQKSLTSKSLLGSILGMLSNLSDLKERAKEAKKVIIPDAAKRLALETLLLAQRGD